MNIVQGHHPRRIPPHIAIRKVKGVLLLEKSGDDIYFYADESNWEVKRNVQFVTQHEFSNELRILADSYSELDGFYCINSITHTISYLGTEWDDVILGLKFRHLSA
ncbi:MAG: hypothetical protein WAN66_08660 [Limnoraphis robusta]|jgi:hypothetical protein|uniref:Uncharacterized protein n=1 Tax=Limnoraphis robusta CS-951 TaxID=1637645 RepID=A0A0F5YC85_9CYAN|nr:hypothetical protein [Limnoraphis robusta]KKD36222.1 hypothetical protein WN50_20950 [Limnoraphis robusta CS-951]MCG5062023.1 hypothetical protein [Limnoraphis sp. WC205]